MTRPIKKTALVFFGILSLLGFYILNRMVALYDAVSGDLLEKLDMAMNGLMASIATRPFFVSLDRAPLLAGVTAVIFSWLGYLYYLTTAKNYMFGQEYGSARWGTPGDIKPLTNPEPDLNIPLSDTEKISLPDVPNFEANRNKNILLIGGSGSGKTFSEYKPSLMQLHSSYVITDPKGTILPDTGAMLEQNGYEIKVFNTVDFSKSMHFNPLAYIRKESDILKVVNVLIENTKGEGDRCTEDFWIKSERLFYTALIAYLWTEAPPEDCNIPMMIRMLELCRVKEEDEDYQNAIDILFEQLAERKPNCLAVKQYAKFKLAAGKTAKSILASCGARLAPFDIAELLEITSYDELGLDEIGDRKTALFIIMSDTDSTYSFIIAMLMYQLFNLLCTKADTEYGGVLPFHVRCLLDEFFNIGKIPDFQHLISTIRSRGISCMIGLQSLAQLTAVYKDDADNIIDNCDTVVFLGGKSKTAKQISEMIGKTTVDTLSASESKGQYGQFSRQNGVIGRDLIDPAEIGRLKRSECLVLITGLPPFKSKKINPSNHPRFKQLRDGGAPIYDLQAALRGYTPAEGQDFTTEATITIDLSVLNDLVEKKET